MIDSSNPLITEFADKLGLGEVVLSMDNLPCFRSAGYVRPPLGVPPDLQSAVKESRMGMICLAFMLPCFVE